MRIYPACLLVAACSNAIGAEPPSPKWTVVDAQGKSSASVIVGPDGGVLLVDAGGNYWPVQLDSGAVVPPLAYRWYTTTDCSDEPMIGPPGSENAPYPTGYPIGTVFAIGGVRDFFVRSATVALQAVRAVSQTGPSASCDPAQGSAWGVPFSSLVKVTTNNAVPGIGLTPPLRLVYR